MILIRREDGAVGGAEELAAAFEGGCHGGRGEVGVAEKLIDVVAGCF